MPAKMSITEARSELNRIGARLSRDHVIYVERHGKTAFALVDAEYLQAVLETLEVMADPKLYAVLKKGLRDVRARRK